jgi:hypothetical protein
MEHLNIQVDIMSFCPDWVFDIAVAKSAQDFLSSEVPIYVVANKYAEGLTEKYSSITKEQICEPAESLLHFLAEVNAGDEAVTFLNGFVYFRYGFEGLNKPRKLKPMFGEADEPAKTKTFDGESAVKHFKAYVFSLRSNSAPVAPPGWRLELEENTLHIAEIARRPISILDAF